MSGDLSVFDMMAEAEKDSPDGISLFSQPPTQSIPEIKDTTKPEPKPEINKSTGWVPDDDDLDELGLDTTVPTGVIYSKEEFKANDDSTLKGSLIDDKISEVAQDTMDELDRVSFNIKRALKKLNIKKLNLPEVCNAHIITLANDKNAFDALVGKIKEFTEMYPGSIIEYEEDAVESAEDVVEVSQDKPDTDNVISINSSKDVGNVDQLNIIIDKSDANEIAFDQEDINKIKKARSVVLNIREEKDVKFTIVDDDSNTPIDNILSQYERKIGDFPLVLPASHYRCVLTGLSYPETLDLAYLYDLNSYDSEKKKWSIIYKHMKNPSIGKFKDFNDFLEKTSVHDLNILLYGILCATIFEEEVISIDCNVENCKKTYEWIYSPKTLIDMESVPFETLEEIRITGESNTDDEIIDNYKTSCLNQKRYVTLPSSELIIALGHSSAKRYLEDIHGRVVNISKNEDVDMTEAFAVSVLNIVDHILVRKSDGTGYSKISKTDNIIQLMKGLDEIDSATMGKLMQDIATSYEFSYTMKNVVCPKCKSTSDIPIEDIASMLFIVARSLQNVNVELKRS